jgi:hypothetical protein
MVKWVYLFLEHTASIFSQEDGGSIFFNNTDTHLPNTWCHTTEKHNIDTATPAMKLELRSFQLQ